jgi:hypothetical protein
MNKRTKITEVWKFIPELTSGPFFDGAYMARLGWIYKSDKVNGKRIRGFAAHVLRKAREMKKRCEKPIDAPRET